MAKTKQPERQPETTSRKTNGPPKSASPAPKRQSEEALSGNSRADLSPEQIYRLIQETAYFKAKARGFAPGREVQDWIEAEAEVRRRIGMAR
jgi:Protein of unknown function (DUF2934)